MTQAEAQAIECCPSCGSPRVEKNMSASGARERIGPRTVRAVVCRGCGFYARSELAGLGGEHGTLVVMPKQPSLVAPQEALSCAR